MALEPPAPLRVVQGTLPGVVKRYLFYRIWRDEKFYLFCRSVGTPNRSNAAPFTEADWLEWAQGEGLQREEVGE